MIKIVITEKCLDSECDEASGGAEILPNYPKDFASAGSGAPHGHGSVKYTVERGSIQIAPYTRDYDAGNSTVALNNNPGVGNSQLAMTPPYQTAIYIIKAF